MVPRNSTLHRIYADVVEWISAGLPPDAYVQMALQLAWYKTRGSFTATYETALTRAFDKARTETIRTLSEDSRAWVLSMTDTSATVGSPSFLLTSVCPDNLSRPPRDSLFFDVPSKLTPAYRAKRRPDVASIGIYLVFDS
jgi:Choline/Carnitine o-acyltransferase